VARVLPSIDARFARPVARKPAPRALRIKARGAFSPTEPRALRPCRALSQSQERKRNTNLQPIDGRRHLHSLNPGQRSAVEYGIDGDAEPPALLIAAGAGTGKTKALAHRWLI
jgi:hypothetical protein